MSKQLTLEQRYEIQALINAKHRKNFIAKQLGVDKSTITREIQRNSGKRSYNAQKAQERYNERKKDVFRKIRFTESMKKFVREKIKDCWSPEQITGYCKRQSVPMVSHETIYQFIYADKEKGGDLYKYLRTARCKRKPKKNKRKGKFSITDRVFIKERPAIVDARERFGDWEVDTIIGANHKGAILVVVERKSMFALYVKTNGKKSESIKYELINLLAPFKKLVHTITSDNGTEFAEHKAIAKKIQCDCSLIANLLITVIQKLLKRPWTLSNLVSLCKILLFNYIHLPRFLENPDKDWLKGQIKIEQLTLF